VLGGGALEILHKLASESDSKAAKSERHSSPDKSSPDKSRGKLRRRCCKGGVGAECSPDTN
jgi:hypothetical protein